MPEKMGNGRFNEDNKYGGKITGSRKIVKKKVARGCPKNNFGAHFYVARKEIRIWTKQDNKVSKYHHIYCLLCDKTLSARSRGRKSVDNPTLGYEIVQTVAIRMGDNVPGPPWGRVYVINTKTYTGNTDEKGKSV